MDTKSNKFNRQGSEIYDHKLSSKLDSLIVPENIYLKSSSDFDDKYIHNEGDKWVFYYSGSRRYINFKDALQPSVYCWLFRRKLVR